MPPHALKNGYSREAASFNKTDAGNGSKAICRVSNVLRSPSPDPKRSLPESYPVAELAV